MHADAQANPTMSAKLDNLVPGVTHTSALKFSSSDGFIKELRKRVDAYFERTGKSKRDWELTDLGILALSRDFSANGDDQG